MTAEVAPEIAYYCPNSMWDHGDWIENSILFFDGVALLVPDYLKEKPRYIDPAVVAGLEDHKLLHILEPEKIVGSEATEQLAAALEETIFFRLT